jgi:hypothetical protein
MQSMVLEYVGRDRTAQYRREAERAGLAALARRRARRSRRDPPVSGRNPVTPEAQAGHAMA